MKLFKFSSLKEFQKQIYPFLIQNEAENSFVFDFAQKIEKLPNSFEEINLWSISEDSKILAASILTLGKEKKFVISKTENNKKQFHF